MQKNSIIIPLLFLLVGFISAYYIFGNTENKGRNNTLSKTDNTSHLSKDGSSFVNPFLARDANTDDDDRIAYLENEIIVLKQQLHQVELSLQSLTNTSESKPVVLDQASAIKNRYASALTQRLYNLDTLIRGGIEPSHAEDIVRRKNSIELKRLELQDRAKRENYLNSQQYFDELKGINQLDTTLREELGDQRYDEFLFDSKQNNRIRIASVMLGSAAEQAGIVKGDIVLNYDNNRMFTWQELKDATAEGQLGEFVSISIYRNGEIYSFSVPRGPLGIQLGATRLQP